MIPHSGQTIFHQALPPFFSPRHFHQRPRPGKVKITGFDIHKVSVRWRDLMFVEVHTDAGITGLGSDTREPYRPKRFLQEVARLKAKAVP
jgi:hypothetical protein